MNMRLVAGSSFSSSTGSYRQRLPVSFLRRLWLAFIPGCGTELTERLKTSNLSRICLRQTSSAPRCCEAISLAFRFQADVENGPRLMLAFGRDEQMVPKQKDAEPTIGIGARVAPGPLPHHLACGSAPGGSTKGSKLGPLAAQRETIADDTLVVFPPARLRFADGVPKYWYLLEPPSLEKQACFQFSSTTFNSRQSEW